MRNSLQLLFGILLLSVLSTSCTSASKKSTSPQTPEEMESEKEILEDPYAPMVSAAAKNELQKVKDYLKGGMDPNQASIHGVTPLMVAARKGHLEMVQLLIKNEVFVDLRDQDGATALQYAVLGKQADTVKALLEANCNTC